MRPQIRPQYSLSKVLLHCKNFRMITSFISPGQATIPDTAYSFLSNRRLLAISGPDSTRYLKGAVTASADSNSRNGYYTAFLNAQGRILNDVFIFPFKEVEGRYQGEQGWLVEVDSEEIESLIKRIKRYQLSSKFEVRAVPQAEKSVWSVWSNKTNNSQIAHLLAPGINRTHPEGDIGCIDQRAPGMGYRLLLSGNRRPELDIEQCHDDYYKIRRYLKGVPEGQKELLNERALPQESNVDLMGGIDYRKGCYIGQELTIRTHHMGVVRKRILPLQIYAEDEKEPLELSYSTREEFGAEKIPVHSCIYQWGKDAKRAGKWLSGMGNVGLGLCRLAYMTKANVKGEDTSYEVGDEFKIEFEGNGIRSKTFKVKAFTPAWHRDTMYSSS